MDKDLVEQIRVGVLGATDTNMTIDEAVDYIKDAVLDKLPELAKEVGYVSEDWVDYLAYKICQLIEPDKECCQCGRPLEVIQHLDFTETPEGKVCMPCIRGEK